MQCRRRPAHPRGQASSFSTSAHDAAIPLGGRADNGGYGCCAGDVCSRGLIRGRWCAGLEWAGGAVLQLVTSPLSLTNSLQRARLGWRVATFTTAPPEELCTCKSQLQAMNGRHSMRVSWESRNRTVYQRPKRCDNIARHTAASDCDYMRRSSDPSMPFPGLACHSAPQPKLILAPQPST